MYDMSFLFGSIFGAFVIQTLLATPVKKLGKFKKSTTVTISAILSVPLISVLAGLGFGVSAKEGFRLYALAILIAWAIRFFIAFRVDIQTTKPAMSENLLSLAFAVFVGAGALLTNKVSIQEAQTADSLTIEEVIQQDVRSSLKGLPSKLDAVTTLVDIKSKGRSVAYFYELDHDSDFLREIETEMKTSVTSGMCAAPEQYINTVEGFISHFHYSPNDSEKYPLKISITKNDCLAE